MQLPASVQEIADVIGADRALYLVERLPRYQQSDNRRPGATFQHVFIYVPTAKRLKTDHRLVQILGWEDAVKLCQAFGGESLHPASCADVYRRRRDEQIREMLSLGDNAAIIAERMKVSERHVRKVKSARALVEILEGANDNQPTCYISLIA